jgi:hypothetical protein
MYHDSSLIIMDRAWMDVMPQCSDPDDSNHSLWGLGGSGSSPSQILEPHQLQNRQRGWERESLDRRKRELSV